VYFARALGCRRRQAAASTKPPQRTGIFSAATVAFLSSCKLQLRLGESLRFSVQTLSRRLSWLGWIASDNVIHPRGPAVCLAYPQPWTASRMPIPALTGCLNWPDLLLTPISFAQALGWMPGAVHATASSTACHRCGQISTQPYQYHALIFTTNFTYNANDSLTIITDTKGLRRHIPLQPRARAASPIPSATPGSTRTPRPGCTTCAPATMTRLPSSSSRATPWSRPPSRRIIMRRGARSTPRTPVGCTGIRRVTTVARRRRPARLWHVLLWVGCVLRRSRSPSNTTTI
jgi:YD repeat-containing protein